MYTAEQIAWVHNLLERTLQDERERGRDTAWIRLPEGAEAVNLTNEQALELVWLVLKNPKSKWVVLDRPVVSPERGFRGAYFTDREGQHHLSGG